MFNISEFFKRTQNKAFKEIAVRTEIRDVIEKHTGAQISLDSIIFSGRSIILKGINPSLKSVIYTKKQKILADIVSIGGLSLIVDIK